MEEVEEVEEAVRIFSDSASDEKISNELIKRQFSSAIEHCLQEGRTVDALLIAVSSKDEELIERTKSSYVRESAAAHPYLHLLSLSPPKGLLEHVKRSYLNDWKATVAIIFNYGQERERCGLLSLLGARLEAQKQQHAAAICYILGRNLTRLSRLWSKKTGKGKEEEEDKEEEDNEEEQTSLVQLVKFAEKLIILQSASESFVCSDAHSAKFIELATLLGSQGLKETASRVLNTIQLHVPNERHSATIKQLLSALQREAPPSQSLSYHPASTSPIDNGIAQPFCGHEQHSAAVDPFAISPSADPPSTMNLQENGTPAIFTYHSIGASVAPASVSPAGSLSPGRAASSPVNMGSQPITLLAPASVPASVVTPVPTIAKDPAAASAKSATVNDSFQQLINASEEIAKYFSESDKTKYLTVIKALKLISEIPNIPEEMEKLTQAILNVDHNVFGTLITQLSKRQDVTGGLLVKLRTILSFMKKLRSQQ